MIGAVGLIALLPAVAAEAATTPVITGGLPIGIAVNESNHRVIVADGLSFFVTIFDGSEAAPAKKSVNVGAYPSGVAVDTGTQLAYVTLPALDKVAVIDLGAATPVLLRTVAVGTLPTSVAVDPILHNVYVANIGSASVSRFAGDDVTPTVSTIGVGSRPEGIAVDTVNHAVFVASQTTGTIARFIGNDATPAATTISGVPHAGSLSVDSRTHTAYSVDLDDNLLHHFSTSIAAPTLSAISVPGTPSAVLADSTTGEVYVTTKADMKVVVLDVTRPGAPVTTSQPVGTNPIGLAIDTSLASRTVYVANRGSSSVSRVNGVLPAAPVITSGAPPAATVGVPYSFTFTATGHPAPIFAASLPAGGQFSFTDDGTISGTPTAPGPVTFTLTARNGVDPFTATQTVTIRVDAAPTPTPTPTPATTTTTAPTSTATPGTTTGGTTGSGSGGSGGSGSGSGGSASTGGGSGGSSSSSSSLAHTGQSLEAVAPFGLAGLLLIAIGAGVAANRSTRGARKRS
ncbi:YncE family protein [Subtercola boreus]|uniref:Dystroglycan-type cadherin-like domain-containing protein n=1 Tax=Subtercola boreus TaxID=120213 RepID=A0A3E0WCW8_9MICO|nr:YncE family protein [Subtercola boreus]RFA22661.1 hypothetical protein B7R24_03340 [Subtercola boreus]RFA23016.1 hypothetical protein B7R23_03335 [Subtercola boreus]RFA28768.1 hypothetical protein B7R25_03350 [Subtercola boreus]